MTQDNLNFMVEYNNYVNPQQHFNNESNMKLNNSSTFIYQDHINLVGFIPNNNTTNTTTTSNTMNAILPQSPDPTTPFQPQYDTATTSTMDNTSCCTSPSSSAGVDINTFQQQHFPSPSPSPYHASSESIMINNNSTSTTFYPDFFQSYNSPKETTIFDQQQQQQQHNHDFIINHTNNKTKEHAAILLDQQDQLLTVEENEDLMLPNNSKITSSSSSSSASSTSGSVISNNTTSNKTGKIVNSELRRQIHIQSEQKRRAQIKDGFEDLRNELPSCLNKKMSKVALLHRTVQHIQHLKNTQMTIYAELERLASENEQLRKFQESVLQKQSLEKMYSSH